MMWTSSSPWSKGLESSRSIVHKLGFKRTDIEDLERVESQPEREGVIMAISVGDDLDCGWLWAMSMFAIA